MKRSLRTLFCTLGLSLCLAAAVSAADAGRVRVDTRLNVRTGAGLNYAICDRLSPDAAVTVYEMKNGFYRIGYGDGKSGYASAAYIQPLHAAELTVHTGNSNLNVRAGGGLGYPVIDRLPSGSVVYKLGAGTGGFYQILYGGGKTGYASRDYLRDAAQDAIKEAVYLSVPSYKQYDSRWKALTLPGSGETLETHGCAVTSLAMAESVRTGTAVTPPDVLRDFAFTEGGAVYWTGYVLDDCSFESIYNTLCRGCPVIFHGRKSGGSTHFVVVYGFKGGRLTAENFLIRDPGAARTTLAAFLAVYDIPVKTVHT